MKVFSPTTRCRTFDGLRFKKYTGKKASLIFLPPISSLIFLPPMAIYTTVSLPSKRKLAYITKPKVIQIHATLVG